jgi:hypothetical protein
MRRRLRTKHDIDLDAVAIVHGARGAIGRRHILYRLEVSAVDRGRLVGVRVRKVAICIARIRNARAGAVRIVRQRRVLRPMSDEATIGMKNRGFEIAFSHIS